MPTEQSPWTFADAWVLTAIAVHGEEGCDLTGLLAAADAINHVILDEDEVSRGIGRLVASGLVTVHDEHFSLTPAGTSLANRRRGGMLGQARSMHSLLQRQELTEGAWPVPTGALDAAHTDYRSRMRDGD